MSGWDQFVASNDPRAIGAVVLGLAGLAVLWAKRVTRHHPKRGPRGGLFGSRIHSLLTAIVFVLALIAGLGAAASIGQFPSDSPTSAVSP